MLLKSLTRLWTPEEKKIIAEHVELQFDEALKETGLTGFIVKKE